MGQLCIPVIYLFSLILLQVSGCTPNKETDRHENNGTPTKQKSVMEIISPKQGAVFTCGDSIPVSYQFDKKIKIDSIALYSTGLKELIFRKNFEKTFWPTSQARPGQNIIKATVYYNDSLKETHSLTFVLLSDIVPKSYSYTLINTFPHDAGAFTQGLIFDKGVLYESTGLTGHSSMRIVEIKTGKVLKKVDLNSDLFGEGIAFFDNMVYQITWKNQVGFVYEKETLNQVRSFDYPISEGWGLTSDNTNMYMTDGSSFLYVIEPEYFTQTDQLDVFDNKGRIINLNELEYIDGKIFANVLGDTFIVIIDPETGKMTGKIELEKLVPEGIGENSNKVLNGIAFNPATRHLYVTGKLWPVLYEIKLNDYFDN